MVGGMRTTAVTGRSLVVHAPTPAGLRDVLDAAANTGVRHVVLVSSATVYGAWAHNPVPLTEDAPLRPNPGFADAAEKAEAERILAEWRDAHPDVATCVLRPAAVVGPGADAALARALAGTVGFRPAEAARPVQYLHVDDLRAAVELAQRQRLEGVYNVAPDGWVPDDTARALAGGTARLTLPERVARPLQAAWRAVFPTRDFPGVEPYTRHPWVVANDRLAAAGWRAEHSNEEAYVMAGEGSKLEISPHRRQEVALAAVAVGAVSGMAAVIALLRRRH
jgi:nucleoside-diphosphate-sugar epimerase